MLMVSAGVLGFASYTEYLRPGTVLPSRRTLGRSVITAFEEGKMELVKILAEADTFAATTDLWSDRRHRTYATVTVHFVGPDWKLQDAVLSTKRIFGRRRGIEIQKVCEDIFEVYSIVESDCSVI